MKKAVLHTDKYFGSTDIDKISHIFFDEFQSESDHYCSDEVKKFISIHQSIARGKGKHFLTSARK